VKPLQLTVALGKDPYVSFTITHTSGAMDADPSRESIPALLDELATSDAEHPDVAVSHDSGWTLSAFRCGRLVWENVEEDADPRHLPRASRGDTERLLRALAEGRIDEVDAEAWQPGYG
jgi:hypothetical protein